MKRISAEKEIQYISRVIEKNISFYEKLKDKGFLSENILSQLRNLYNTENKNILYTPITELSEFDNIPELVEKFNQEFLSINPYGENILVIENGFVYIKSYETKSIEIVRLLEYCSYKLDKNLRDIVDFYIEMFFDKSGISLDKVDILNTIFKKSNIALIYGSAGTGKTKMLELLAEAFKHYNKYFITVTNAAVSNLSTRIHEEKCKFKTISEFIKCDVSECDILFIDECSMISNNDIISILSKQRYKAIVMVGDIYQIESIRYGNWFQLCNRYFEPGIKYELSSVNRTTDEGLLALWSHIRNDDKKAINILSTQEFTQPLSNDIFKKDADEEIVLSLNYDGMYGINNINKIRQGVNPNPEYTFGVDTYKVGDRVLFNDCPRFKDFLYNNLKGTISEISIDEENRCWWFTIEINRADVDLDFCPKDVEIYQSEKEDKINVCFKVNEFIDKDDDENEYGHIIPFNLAYAISIHKAQGLEYESVKIVITSNIEDKITKNIFYTAITRSKKMLKIYWSADSQTRIFDNFNKNNCNKDISIIRQKIKKGN